MLVQAKAIPLCKQCLKISLFREIFLCEKSCKKIEVLKHI